MPRPMTPEGPLNDVVTFLSRHGRFSPMSLIRRPQIDSTGLAKVTETFSWALSWGAIFIKAVYTVGYPTGTLLKVVFFMRLMYGVVAWKERINFKCKP